MQQFVFRIVSQYESDLKEVLDKSANWNHILLPTEHIELILRYA